MSAVRFLGISDNMISDQRRFMYENDDYTASLCVGFVDEDAPIDPEYYTILVVQSKNEEVPGYMLADVHDIRMFDGTILGNPTVGFTLFGSPRYFSIGKNSSEGLRRGKQFFTELDTIMREQFPGYGILYHEDDSHFTREERTAARKCVGEKRAVYFQHTLKYSLVDLLNEAFTLIPVDEIEGNDGEFFSK